MAYTISHPLAIEDDLPYLAGPALQRNLTIFNDEVWPFDSPLDTFHPLDECEHCHDYVKHVDHALLSPSHSFAKSQGHEKTYLEGIEEGRRLQRDLDETMFSRYRGRLETTRAQHEESKRSNTECLYRVTELEHELALAKDRLVAVQMAYDDLSMEQFGQAGATNWDQSSQTVEHHDYFNPSPVRLATPPIHEDQQDVWEVEPNEPWSGDDWSSDEDSFDFQQLLLDESISPQFWSDYHHDDASSNQIEDCSSSSTSSSPSLSSSSAISDPQSSLSSLVHVQPVPSLPSAEQGLELSISQLAELVEAAHEPGATSALDEVRLLIQDAERTPRKQRTPAQVYLLLTWRPPSPGSRKNVSAAFYHAPEPSSTLASTSNQEMFVDASPYGVGMIFGQHWLAWTFSLGHPSLPRDLHNRPIMSWAELVAVELGVRAFIAAGYRDTVIKMRSDNAGVVEALTNKKWTTKYGLDSILLGIFRLCDDAGLRLRVEWVPTKSNPADGPSRGKYPPKELMYPHQADIPRYLKGLIKVAVPK